VTTSDDDPIPPEDTARAQHLARHYGCEFVELQTFDMKSVFVSTIPEEVMFRYNFVPLEETREGSVIVAVADPSQLMMMDEIQLHLGKRIIVKVAPFRQISNLLRRLRKNRP
jgi:type IV pilus assembly protein PilB